MELASQSISDLFLAKGGLDHMAPPEAALNQTVQDITAEIIGIRGEKLDLYVPSQAIIEPISPAEEVPDENNVLTMTTHDTKEPDTAGTGDTAQSLSNTNTNLVMEADSSVSDTVPTDALVESAVPVIGSSCEKDFPRGSTPVTEALKDNRCSKWDSGVRKLIPPKKNRLEPLKIDMSKTPTIPLTSSQLSLQCLECHIIFSDHKSKQRHIKMSHPSEYEQCVLGDSLFTCYVCDKCFTCSTELMAHQRAHTERLPFKCPICREAFGRSNELTNHKKEHFSEQHGGYTCSDCGKLHKTITLLRYHQRKHTGERPYVCIHKECGKRFSMPKALQKHLEVHEKQEAEGVTNATGKMKKQKMGPSGKKFACSQCDESFKTAKSQLRHIKTKHTKSRAILPSNNIVIKEGMPVPTEIVHPSLLCMEPVSQAQQQMGPLGVEQIKKLIEKLGNVQKVNQLVIFGIDQLPLQQQTTGQQAQGVMQPLHFNFTEPTFQPEEPGHQETATTGPSLESLENVAGVEQEKTVVQNETSEVSLEYQEKQTSAVEPDMSETQMNDVQYEVMPELTEKLVLTAEASQDLQHPTEEQCAQVVSDAEALETAIAASTIVDLNSKPCEEEHVLTTVDISLSENANADSDSLCQQVDATDSLVEPEVQTGLDDDNPEFVLRLEEVDLKDTSLEDTNSQICPPSVSKVEAEEPQEKPQMEQEPHSEPDIQQSVDITKDATKDQNLSRTEDLPHVKKPLPIKKKISKRQVPQKDEVITREDEVVLKTSPKAPSLKMGDAKDAKCSKTQKKRDKGKSKKLIVCFGPRENKEKYSKRKLLQISKPSLHKDQLDADPRRVPALSKTDVQHLKPKKKNQKHEKGRKAKHAPGHINSLNLLSDPKELTVPEEKHRGKPKKRKFENQQDLVKKGKPAQSDETPVPKKKKHGGISEVTSQKKVEKKRIKKGKKLPKQKEMDKNVSEPLTLDQIKQQALLLLKGHKQPQLKVHKLDAKTTGLQQQLTPKCQTKESSNQVAKVLPGKQGTPNKSMKMTSQKKKKTKTQTMGKKSKVEHRESGPVGGDISSGGKQKVARKRKAPVKIDQEIALSPPYSQVVIGCHDCGKNFSEVSALQEHMASMHSENGLLRSSVVCEVSSVCSRVNEVMLVNAVHQSSFEIQVSTDWDMETEMGEIGLDGRGEHRLSFPALNPSPSFPLRTNSVEGQDKEDECPNQETYQEQPEENPREVNPPFRSTEQATCLAESNGKKAREQEDVEERPFPEVSEGQGSIEVKARLSSDENSVLVEHNDAHDYMSSQVNNLLNDSQQGSDYQDPKAKNIPALSLNGSPAKTPNTALTQEPQLAEQSEVNQDQGAMLLQRVETQTKTTTRARGRGRGSKGRGRKQLGKRNASGNRLTKDKGTIEEDCQVVYELYSLTDNVENKQDEQVDENSKATHGTAASVQPALGESSKVQETIALESANTAAAKELIGNGSLIQTPDKIGSSCSSDRQDGSSVHCQDEMTGLDNPQSDCGVTSDGTSPEVKMEVTPSVLSPHNEQTSERSLLQGVQVILVKAEDHHISDDPHVLQGNQHGQIQDTFQVGIFSGLPQPAGKQCIFYPVKEEQREMLVEPPLNEQSHFDLETSEQRTTSWVATGLGECQEIRVGCTPVEMHHNLYSGIDEGSVATEQQSTEDFLEFLSQTSDTDDCDNIISDPEAETHILSCYHGIDNSPAKQQQEKSSFEQSGRNSKNTGRPLAECHEGGSRECPKPIDYFVQYFSWNTWKEIAAYTALKLPVTEKEVAQVVGIHIAMGTLKFPSLKLYWEEYTRVSLIADAMPASRFFELASKLRLASPRGESSNRNEQSSPQSQLDPSPESGDRSRIRCTSSQFCVYQDCGETSESSVDPLWKVRAVVNTVQEGCRALERTGNHGVDQYRLPFERHPTHSLHHAVMVSNSGMVVDFSLRVHDCHREQLVEKMVSREKGDNQGTVFLCKPELSTPSMLEHLLEAGVRSAGKVGGARGQIGDEFVTSDGKLKLFRCHHGFILSAVSKEKSRSTSIVSGFERAIKAANLNRDLRSLYRTPCTCASPSAWPQSVLWDLVDLALVNSWLQYKQDQNHLPEPLSLIAFRLEVSKALILSSRVDAQDSSPPYPPSPIPPIRSVPCTATAGTSDAFETPLPEAAMRYDGFGHWPEQLPEGQEARCRFGGCERTSRVRCLKCCVFLCISRNHNCFLKFHSQAAE